MHGDCAGLHARVKLLAPFLAPILPPHIARAFAGCLLAASTACAPSDRKDEVTAIGYGGPTTIYDIHAGVVDSGDNIELTGVVALLPRTPADDWFIVQAPEGGEYAGLEVHLHHALPQLTIVPGDVLTIRGVLASRNARVDLIVQEADAIEVTGFLNPEPSRPGDIVDWSPYNGVLVAPGPTSALDCGDTAGQVATDRDLHLDFSHFTEPVSLGTGSLDDLLQGVVHGVAETWSLSVRTLDDLGSTLPDSGCPTTVADARQSEHSGRLVLEDTVVTAVQPDGRRAYVQDVGGGAWSGLEVQAAPGTLSHLVAGDQLTLGGLLNDAEPRLLQVTHLAAPTSVVEPVSSTPTDPTALEWDGALVELANLEVQPSEYVGRANTSAGIELVDVLLDGTPLPDSGTWTIRGQLRVDPSTEPPTVHLLPRVEADLQAAD